MVSPFAMHQQQLAMLAQQQSLLMAAAAKSAGMDQKFPGIIQQPVSNGSNLPSQSWPNVGYQIPGLMMPVDGQADLQKVTQVGSVRLNYVMLLFRLFASIEFLILFLFWVRVRQRSWDRHIHWGALFHIQHLGMSYISACPSLCCHVCDGIFGYVIKAIFNII